MADERDGTAAAEREALEKVLTSACPTCVNWHPGKGDPLGFPPVPFVTGSERILAGEPVLVDSLGPLFAPDDVERTAMHLDVNMKMRAVLGLTLGHAAQVIQPADRVTGRMARFREPFSPVTLELHYPFNKAVRVTIPPYRRVGFRGEQHEMMDAGYLFWMLAHAYQQVYVRWEEFEVWGHEYGDLFFEGLVIFGDGRARLSVGS